MNTRYISAKVIPPFSKVNNTHKTDNLSHVGDKNESFEEENRPACTAPKMESNGRGATDIDAKSKFTAVKIDKRQMLLSGFSSSKTNMRKILKQTSAEEIWFLFAYVS